MMQLGFSLKPIIGRIGRALATRAAPQRLVGLDISGYQIKMAIMQRRRADMHLDAFCVEKVDGSGFRDEAHLWEHQRMLLNMLVVEHELKGEKVIAVLPFNSYVRREIILPKMPRKELKKAIHYETRKFSDGASEDAVVDFVTVNEFEQEGVRYASHLVIMMDRVGIQTMLSRLQELGLDVVGFGVVPLALRNTIAAMSRRENGEIRSVLDIGKEDVSLSLFRNDELVFTRDIPGSGHSLTNALLQIVVPGGETVELEYPRAEALKLRYGVIAEQDMNELSDDGIPLQQIAVMMRPVLERMLIEIQRSIDFCQEQYRIAPPSILYLSGGGSRLRNLRNFLQTRLHLDVEFLDPLGQLSFAPGVDRDLLAEQRYDLMTAIGLGMNVAGGRFYFMPEEFRVSDNRWARPALRAASVAGLITSLSVFGGYTYQHKQIEKRVDQKRLALENLQRFEAEHRVEADAIRVQRFRREMLLELLGPGVPWGDILKDLSHRVLSEVQLTEVQWLDAQEGDQDAATSRVLFRGLISTQHERPEFLIAQLLSEFHRSPYFDDVQLESVRTVQNDIAGIELTCELLY